jgi:hypothetical protein
MLLLHYLQFYRNIYELPPEHRPETTVIENDQKLDHWWHSFKMEQDRKAGRRGGDPKYDLLGRNAEQHIPKFTGGYG